jgi:hypothetical protein
LVDSVLRPVESALEAAPLLKIRVVRFQNPLEDLGGRELDALDTNVVDGLDDRGSV